MIGHAFRVLAFCNAYDDLWHDDLFLFHYLEVTDYVDCGFRRDQSKFVQILILKEFVGNLDDALLAVDAAGEVCSDSDLAFDALEVKDVKSLIYVFSRDVVQNGTILPSAYY